LAAAAALVVSLYAGLMCTEVGIDRNVLGYALVAFWFYLLLFTYIIQTLSLLFTIQTES